MTYRCIQKEVGSDSYTYSEWRSPCRCNRFWNNVEREDCGSGECSVLTFASPPEHWNWTTTYLLYSVKPQIFYWESAVCIILHVYTPQRFLASYAPGQEWQTQLSTDFQKLTHQYDKERVRLCYPCLLCCFISAWPRFITFVAHLKYSCTFWTPSQKRDAFKWPSFATEYDDDDNDDYE
jgi:hypothetical protein